ncbi:MAG: signal peptidase II [Clostridia bacterium]|nr:signal peptidase II [Clostridia bacterium]
MRSCKHPKLLVLLVTLFGIALDQLTKLIVDRTMALGESIPLFEGVLHITYIRNRGAAFGMLADNRWVFLTVSTVVIVVLAAFLALTKMRDPLALTALSMILSGGIGTMIDRLALGYVIDFIDFRLINFAVFNGADSFVCVGAALFLLATLLDLRRQP